MLPDPEQFHSPVLRIVGAVMLSAALRMVRPPVVLVALGENEVVLCPVSKKAPVLPVTPIVGGG